MLRTKTKNMEYEKTVNPRPEGKAQEDLLEFFESASTRNMSHLSRVRIRSSIDRLRNKSLTWGGVISLFLLTNTKITLTWKDNNNQKRTLEI